MAANNVVGTLQPIAELANITKAHGALFHTDAVQAVGKISLHMDTLPIDLLSVSAHKLHGPKGIGALYIRQGVKIEPVLATWLIRQIFWILCRFSIW
jgi:cysteine desulfurase